MQQSTVELASHYVRVLLGMVVGLGLTHLIRSLARIIDRRYASRPAGFT